MHRRRRGDRNGRRAPLIRRAAILAAALLALAAYRMAPETGAERITVAARAVPIDPSDPAHTRFGRLQYLGGLELSAHDRRFGGISGMRFLPDGRLQAVSDDGGWITLTLREDGDRLVGLGPVTLAKMADLTGRPLRTKLDADAEALELEPDGTPVVAYERTHRVWRYDVADGRPRPRPFPDPMWLQHLGPNTGIEAMARIGDLWLFLAEDAGGSAYNGILQGGGALSATYGRIDYTPPDGFSPTDAAALDPTHVLILNRRYSPLMGVAAALTLAPIDARRLAMGKPELIATLASPLGIDNMEALDVRHTGGRTFVYMASDDNFSPLQRTLLLKFELLPRN